MISEWWMPVNAHFAAVRPRSVGPTRAVEPSEAAVLLPVRELAEWMAWPNQTYLRGRDAHHLTSLCWPG